MALAKSYKISGGRPYQTGGKKPYSSQGGPSTGGGGGSPSGGSAVLEKTKYYFNPETGLKTYRVGGAEPPKGYQEISQSSYQSSGTSSARKEVTPEPVKEELFATKDNVPLKITSQQSLISGLTRTTAEGLGMFEGGVRVRPPEGFVTKVKKTSVDIPVIRESGFTSIAGEPIARATKITTGEQFELIGGEFKRFGETKTVRGIQTQFITEKLVSGGMSKVSFDGAQTLIDGAPISRLPPGERERVLANINNERRINQKVFGMFEQPTLFEKVKGKFETIAISKLTGGKMRYFDEAIANFKTRIVEPIFYKKTATETRIGPDLVTPLNKAILKLDEKLSPTTKKYIPEHFNKKITFLDVPFFKPIKEKISPGTKEFITKVGESPLKILRERPSSAAIDISLGIATAYISKKLPNLSVVGGEVMGTTFVAQTVTETISAPTPGAKAEIVGGALTSAGLFGIGAGIGSVKSPIKTETIKVKYNVSPNLLKKKQIKPFSYEELKVIKVIGKERPVTKQIKEVIGYEEKVILEKNIDPFSKKESVSEVVSKVPIEKIKEVPIQRISDITTGIKVLTKPYKTTVKVKTFGLDVGSRGLPIATKIISGSDILRTKIRPYSFSQKLPKGFEPIRLADLTSYVSPARTATGIKAQMRIFELTAKERTRIRKNIEIDRALGGEKGLNLIPEIDVVGISKPDNFQKIVERRTKQYGGEFFGTVTTRSQLPKEFQKKILGDIDIKFDKSIGKVQKIGTKITKDLLKSGENVRFEPKELAIYSEVTGGKIIEFKANQPLHGEQVIDAFAGFKFGNRRSVKTGKYYKVKTTPAGEQLQKKGAAVTFFRPEVKNVPDLPKEFRGAGVLPRGKRMKDLLDYLAQSLGLVEVRNIQTPARYTSVGRALRLRRTQKAERNIKEFIETFKPEQQKVLFELTKESTKGGIEIPVKFKGKSKITKISEVIEPIKQAKLISPKGKIVSKGRGSPIANKIISKQSSPSKYKEISLIPSKSKISEVPYDTPYKLPSPKSVTSLISRSPILSIKSISSPSPKSPSYGYKLIPGTVPPPPRLIYGDNILKGKSKPKKYNKDISSRKTKYLPSLVAIEKRTRGKKPKFLTGLEIRPINF